MAEELGPAPGPSNEDTASQPAPRAGGCALPWWVMLAGMAVALVLAAIILGRVVEPLSGLLFPAEAPRPGGATLVETYDESRVYRTDQPAVDVAAFYQSKGGACQYAPASLQQGTGPYVVAECQGETERYGSSVYWTVSIWEGYGDTEGPTVFRLYEYEELD